MITPGQISGMPQMKAAFAGWFSNITVVRIAEEITDGFVETTETEVTFKGTFQPLDPEQIQLKPDGQRSWQWVQIHCLTGSLNLETNDRILFNDTKYKVMNVYDYSLNNFIEYHLVRDYESE